jgi:hypothetical protein
MHNTQNSLGAAGRRGGGVKSEPACVPRLPTNYLLSAPEKYKKVHDWRKMRETEFPYREYSPILNMLKTKK